MCLPLAHLTPGKSCANSSVPAVDNRLRRAVRMMGAELALDFRKKSYSEELENILVVVDTLGREKEGSQRMLKEAKGAAYVSLQPKVLKVKQSSKNAEMGRAVPTQPAHLRRHAIRFYGTDPTKLVMVVSFACGVVLHRVASLACIR